MEQNQRFIRSITNNSNNYYERYMRIKTLKLLELYSMAIVAWFVFNKANKYYLQVFLDEYLHKLNIWLDWCVQRNKCYQSRGLRECINCHYWVFLDINVRFDPKVCNYCNNLMLKAMSFRHVTIASVKGKWL